jgi:hypothetical protein
MNSTRHSTRWITTGLLATTVLTLASPAFAGSRRYKRVHHTVPAPTVVVQHRSSHAGPVIAGMIGGFLLGAAVVNARPVVVHEHRNAPPLPV